MKRTMTWMAIPALIGLLAAGCGPAATGGDNANKKGISDSVFGGSKADLGKKAKVVENIAPDSTVEGEFDPRVRAYGYSFDVKKGAKLTIDLEAVAGDDARGLEEGDTLDTVMALYQGFEQQGVVGEKLVEHDDGEESLAAPSITFEAEETGTYFLAFMSYDDTGTGNYKLSLGCDGTDLQCSRPDYSKPCEEGDHYVQGGEIAEDTTWNTCNVVLLEPTRVTKEAILTIKPGVTVQGNYISEEGRNFGTVSLDVRGSIQAVGTEEHPIAFTALKERGWRGIKIRGKSNTLEHIIVEKAHTAISLFNKAEAEVRHSLLEGGLTYDEDREVESHVGIRAQQNAKATFTHASIKGFRRGILSENTQELIVKHAVIRDNETGVRIEGDGYAGTGCGRQDNFDTYRDPVFQHTDIFNNGRGIQIRGSNIFVQVEKSNIINNENWGLELQGAGLADNSYLRENNIYGNNGATEEEQQTQVRTFHRDNTIVLEDNYWRFISDPELHNSWDARCDDGDISFTGFSPEPIADAGPLKEEVKEEVHQQSWAQYKQQENGE